MTTLVHHQEASLPLLLQTVSAEMGAAAASGRSRDSSRRGPRAPSWRCGPCTLRAGACSHCVPHRTTHEPEVPRWASFWRHRHFVLKRPSCAHRFVVVEGDLPIVEVDRGTLGVVVPVQRNPIVLPVPVSEVVQKVWQRILAIAHVVGSRFCARMDRVPHAPEGAVVVLRLSALDRCIRMCSKAAKVVCRVCIMPLLLDGGLSTVVGEVPRDLAKELNGQVRKADRLGSPHAARVGRHGVSTRRKKRDLKAVSMVL